MASATGEHKVCMTPVEGVSVTVNVNSGKGFEVEWRDVRCLGSSTDADVSRNATPRAHTEEILNVQGLLKVVLKIVFGEEKEGNSDLPRFESKGGTPPQQRAPTPFKHAGCFKHVTTICRVDARHAPRPRRALTRDAALHLSCASARTRTPLRRPCMPPSTSSLACWGDSPEVAVCPMHRAEHPMLQRSPAPAGARRPPHAPLVGGPPGVPSMMD